MHETLTLWGIRDQLAVVVATQPCLDTQVNVAMTNLHQLQSWDLIYSKQNESSSMFPPKVFDALWPANDQLTAY